MDPTPFVEGIRALAGRTPLFPGDALDVALVLNPRAGGFAHRARYSSALAQLKSAQAESAALPPRSKPVSFRERSTEAPRHASRLAEEFLDEAALRPASQWLVILACGDGTSHEYLDALSRAPDDLRERFTVLRLPMGTGNDGSDGRYMPDALARLTGHGRPAIQAALRVRPKPGGPASTKAPDGEWRAFNIASVGLDAYVTVHTNRLKSAMPGDFYKLWLDLASVFYDRFYPPGPMVLSAIDARGKEQSRHEGRFLLAAMGVSGHRAYGAGKLILPSDHNVCAIRQMGLLRKLALKGPISSGRHDRFPEAELFSADTLVIDYADKLLAQVDGETHELEPADFPLRMERTGPLIRYLARAD
ncbi:MAG: diacylglycerol kinase [Spirochaetales bacterium]|nr:diacylglycerol kinase [Spirochaetales bacterium]